VKVGEINHPSGFKIQVLTTVTLMETLDYLVLDETDFDKLTHMHAQQEICKIYSKGVHYLYIRNMINQHLFIIGVIASEAEAIAMKANTLLHAIKPTPAA